MIKKIVLFTLFAWISLFMGNRAFAQDCSNNPTSVTAVATGKSGVTVASISWVAPNGSGGTSVFSENFNGSATGWTFIPANTGWKINNGYADATAADSWLISPQINSTTAGEIYWLSYNILSKQGTHSYEVYISTDFTGDLSTSTYDLLYSGTPGISNTVETKALDISKYAGETIYILFKHTGGTGPTDGIELSNIVITENPTLFDIYENGKLIGQEIGGVNHYECVLTATNLYQYCVSANGCEPVCATPFLYQDPNDKSDVWLGVDNNWNNTSNWSTGNVPQNNADVTIPGNVAYYPDLKANTNTVKSIHFKPGAQIGGLQYLHYTNAYVQYDLSKRETWNMLSIPLMEVFPGDFTFGWYPKTWVQTFGSNQSSSTTIGTWTTLRQSTDAFAPGDGFVIFLNSDDHAGEPQDPTKGLKLTSDILELPYYSNIDQNAHLNITYTAPTETFYSITNSGGYTRGALSYTVPRTANANKLATGDVSKSLDFANNIALTGNPYMAALDFDALSGNNSGVIKANYYVWEGSSYKSYNATLGLAWGIDDQSLTEFIAPLQGFLVEKADNASSSDLAFNVSMTSAAQHVQLRSSVNKDNTLYIDASNPMATIRAIIAKREGGQDEFGNMDARKITNGVSSVPEIYTLKQSKGSTVAAGVNVINNDDELIPVGLTTNYAGEIKLSFSGMNTYNATISLIDAVAKSETDLTGLASFDYTFNNAGTPATCEDRFFIHISKSVTGLTEPTAEKANVFESNGLIQVVSGASNPIKEVSVYSLQGALLYKESSLQSISYTVNRNLPSGVYIVKVISEKGNDNFKLIVKK